MRSSAPPRLSVPPRPPPRACARALRATQRLPPARSLPAAHYRAAMPLKLLRRERFRTARARLAAATSPPLSPRARFPLRKTSDSSFVSRCHCMVSSRQGDQSTGPSRRRTRVNGAGADRPSIPTGPPRNVPQTQQCSHNESNILRT
eukprot:7472544-Pyramimonas_sp.AAC.1